jgi:hypothetical protein
MTSEMVLLVETLTMEQDRKAARQIWPTDTVERRQILELAENTAALWETIEMALVQLQNRIKSFDYRKTIFFTLKWIFRSTQFLYIVDNAIMFSLDLNDKRIVIG